MFLILHLLNDGGPLFMYTNLLVLVAIVFFLVKAFSKSENTKAISLVKHLSLFALVWGFLGQILGLIDAFDTLQIVNDVSPQILAAGLKIASLSPAFGMLIFLIARIGLIVLAFLKKEETIS